jgi:hypothetical protein
MIYKKIALILMLTGTLFLFSGCVKPYDKPEFITVETSQTAFLIPLVGDISTQKQFMSEEFLSENKVATKEIRIPHRWIQTGRMSYIGEWRDSAKVIIVERKPETREWTESSSSGTSSKNEGITAESKESISFMARMNCSAQIDESDAVKFLYRYNNKTLEQIMDFEIRARVESKFVEECANRTLEDILLNKKDIMNTVRTDVSGYFKNRGITITSLGLKGDFTYPNKAIQKSIDDKFKSAQELITQKNINEKIISEAEAKNKAIKLQKETIDTQIKMLELENQKRAIAKWNGEPPEFIGGGNGMIFNIPTNK